MAGKTSTFRIGPEPMAPDEMNRWLKAQMPYPNLAGNAEVANRAREFVEQKIARYESDSMEVREKWETLDYMLRGNSLSQIVPDSDIHVPLMYAAVESLVPMLVDALMGLDPWFEVQGRDRHDRQRASKIQAWLRYQCDLTKLPQRLEEIARTFIVYQFVAMKSGWDVRYRNQVVRDVERGVGKDGFPEYTFTPKDSDVQYYEGNWFDIVDPYRFFCDLTETDPQKMQFIGDVVSMGEDELVRLADQGRYLNVEKVLEKLGKFGSQNDLRASRGAMQARSLSGGFLGNLGGFNRGKGQPAKLQVAECWCTWRPDDDSKFEEWVITVCNGVVLRVQKNPHDNKHRPYAISRAAKEPFDFFNVGVLDHSIRLNIEIDDHRNLARKSHKMSLCPLTSVGHDYEGPENLWEAEVGQVIRLKEAPTFHKVQSTVAEMIPFEQVMRRDVEQATGAFGAFEGGTESNTATEYERKVQLRNLRNRRLTFAFADGITQLLEHFYFNTQQFVTLRKPFKVLGSDALALGIDYEISPEDLADPVDILITGPDRLQTYGLRATQVTSFIQQVAPFIPMLTSNGDLNVPALVDEMFKSIVGHRLGENILRVPKPMDESVDPEKENLSLMMGGEAEVHPGDDDAFHNEIHDAAAAYAAKKGDVDAERRIAKHQAAHDEQAAQKAARRKAMAEQGPTGPFRPGESLGSRHAPAEGRGFQRQPDLMGDVVQQTPPGETPGPPRMGSMGSPDREPATSQSQNR